MAWVPKTHAEDHAARHADGGADELDAADLASGAASDGHVLTADGAGGAAWEAATGGASALDDLTDVTITTPTTGQVVKYNGSAWINDTDDTGTGLPAASTKGDIAVYNGSAWVIVAAGANDTVLTADSAQSAGVKWAAASGGSMAWTSYTPTWIDSAGNTLNPGTGGSLTGKYALSGDFCAVIVELTIGTSPTLGTGNNYYKFGLPFDAVGNFSGSAYMFDASAGHREGTILSGNFVTDPDVFMVVGPSFTSFPWKNDLPAGWANGDKMFASLQYQTT